MQDTLHPGMTIGELVRSRRLAINLTLSGLARQAGISKGVISKIENEETKKPELRTMTTLARVLFISVEQIIETYVEVERRREVLLQMLTQAMELQNERLVKKVALRYLQLPTEDSYDLMAQLFGVSNEIDDLAVQEQLLEVIIGYAREHGMQPMLAKGLWKRFMSAFLSRGHFGQSHIQLDSLGAELIYYVHFLSVDKQRQFYFGMAIIAYEQKKYDTCLTYYHEGIGAQQEKGEVAIPSDNVETVAMRKSISNVVETNATKAATFSLLAQKCYESAEFYLLQLESMADQSTTETIKLAIGIIQNRRDNSNEILLSLRNDRSVRNKTLPLHAAIELMQTALAHNDLSFFAENMEHVEQCYQQPVKKMTPIQYLLWGKYYQLKGRYLIRNGNKESGWSNYCFSLEMYEQQKNDREILNCMWEMFSISAKNGIKTELKSVTKRLEKKEQRIDDLPICLLHE
ncbi:helix-turn-helix domain-containing protein [Brevibacillus daliensis]|uniref:helix-turn-helix domain-containing protein n=1 Tax=Brevibacillus daliensis TaxID=2892995 RepID=UPI001E2FEFEA|nr:helix-turn-helix transcriptional regulator [Brevibacillus daliensis]